MALAPLHPAEPDLHHELRDALNERVSNTDFFVWIAVTPLGGDRGLRNPAAIVKGVDTWLATLDADAVAASADVPELELFDPAATVRVRALPKKREARGVRSRPIVGNPEPVLVGWT